MSESGIARYVEDAIARTAINPPVVHDPEEGAASAIELFNNGATALHAGFKHRFGPFGRFGLRLKLTVKEVRRRDEHGHPTTAPDRRIVLYELFPGAISSALSLLGIALREKRTFEYTGPDTPHRHLSKSQLSNIKEARDWLALSPEEQVKQAQAALAKKEGVLPGDVGLPTTHVFTPKDWQWMEDFILMLITPACSRQAIDAQAKTVDGWWRRIGRQRKVGRKAAEKAARLVNQVESGGRLRGQNRKLLKYTFPNAGGMVPPNWTLTHDGLIPKSLSRAVYPFDVPYTRPFRKRINPRRAKGAVAFVDEQDIQEGSGLVYSENVRDDNEIAKMFYTPITIGSPGDSEMWVDDDLKKNGEPKKPEVIRHKLTGKTIIEVCQKTKPKRDIPIMDRAPSKTHKDYFEE